MDFKKLLLGRDWKKTLIRAVVLGGTAYLLFTFVLIPVKNSTHGMIPTIDKGDVVWINALAYLSSDPNKGDVVGIALAGPSFIRMSRILAVPGDEFEVRSGVIYINGEKHDSPRFQIEDIMIDANYPKVRLDPGEYFVVGDNRTQDIMTLNSEGAFGRVEKRRLIGKVMGL